MKVYVDDMLVKSLTVEEHVGHLEKVFEVILKYGMRLNPQKCIFGVINIISRREYTPTRRRSKPSWKIVALTRLADRSNKIPLGYVEDVLVQVASLTFPADFYVIDMEPVDADDKEIPILLGKPFMRTARTKIDVYSGELTFKIDGDIISYNVFDAMRFDAMGNKITLAQDAVPLPLLETVQSLEAAAEVCYSSPSPILFPSNKFLPSIIQAPKLDLKVLPEHLKYVYFGENETHHH
ncbi:hypothetical protein ACLB2K_041043 [Fragaria x ananassa]